MSETRTVFFGQPIGDGCVNDSGADVPVEPRRELTPAERGAQALALLDAWLPWMRGASHDERIEPRRRDAIEKFVSRCEGVLGRAK